MVNHIRNKIIQNCVVTIHLHSKSHYENINTINHHKNGPIFLTNDISYTIKEKLQYFGHRFQSVNLQNCRKYCAIIIMHRFYEERFTRIEYVRE